MARSGGGRTEHLVRRTGREARWTGRRAAGSRWLRSVARGGLAAKGVLYLVIGWIALQIAFGNGDGREADNMGALRLVAQNPVGLAALAAAAAGLGGLAVRELALGLLGGPYHGGRWTGERLGAVARGAGYAVLCGSTTGFLLGVRRSVSQDEQSVALTARVMALPGGQLLVGAAALVLVGAGCYAAWWGVSRGFERELRTGDMPPGVRRAVVALGVTGSLARAVVIVAAGVLVGWAAWSYHPDRAQGLDGALRALAETPAGPWLLVAVAAGVCVYGLYCFCEARWARDHPPS
ncbi:DUF1206 domain-containing protein [Marinitenerispora sediminis]|uniref:DUF1206 domain-containing protein n=1 Tax=Marinitenerispora sediminis TaxID=1931232 RepID=A0A368T8N2_9ACTN|nr:DUF1206 domain-containing protein [Marinitenerispora sediminis]RCV53520.1 DUF1206 domain-containing protein [Marinitenerispora sediminis]RCV57677.1 DUF1206 domain-containing protein [Marinitenerispora sediminis]RCV60767.1 DUF1206 domain-containing protein [Marinitenerispora sediminis]